mgnify:CR=1 FL=1
MERDEAREEGREQMLTEQIKKKLAKGKSLCQIAEELEEEEEHVSRLIEKIKHRP